MTTLASFYWGLAVYKGLKQLLDEGQLSIDTYEELVQHYKDTIAISADELERKLEQLKQKKTA